MASLVPATDDAFERLATHRIRAAIKEGEFDNLEGSGKPLPKRDHDQDVVAKVGGSACLRAYGLIHDAASVKLAAFRSCEMPMCFRSGWNGEPPSEQISTTFGSECAMARWRLQRCNWTWQL